MSALDDVVAAVRVARAEGPRVLVAVDGPDAAGKTTLADALAPLLGAGVVRASIDGFHHPRAVRVRRGEMSPEGYYHDSFDLAALRSLLLQPFAEGATEVRTRIFDFRSETPVAPGPVVVPARAVLVFDGVFLLRPELRAWWDVSVYVDVPPEVTLARALVRDVALFGSEAEVRRRYEQRYLPGQQLYREEADPIGHADLVIDNVDPGHAVVRAR